MPQTRRFSRKAIEESYREHPVRMENLLRKISPEKLKSGQVTVADLAYDEEQGLTDQNHIGGAGYVLEIGRRLGITERTKVLELGSGIGGAARVLSSEFGCNVTGIDLTEGRVSDAKRLSKLCGLGRKNRFLKGDFNSPPRGVGKGYDVILSQNSLVHAPHPQNVLQKWVPLLKPGGKLAIEEIFLRMRPSARQLRRLERLLVIWNSYLHQLGSWNDALHQAGCEFQTFENLTSEMRSHFDVLVRHQKEHGTLADEHESYALALALIDEGVLGYFRVISMQRPGA